MRPLTVSLKALAMRCLPASTRRTLRGFLWSVAGLREGAAKPIDLTRAELIWSAEIAALENAEILEREILPALGLNDEGFEQIPEELYAHCGRGLRCWQYPSQFSQYLVLLSKLGVRSYLEIGVRHGGTFVTTVEYLSRFHPLTRAVAVDLGDCPALREYAVRRAGVRFLRMNSQSPEFAAFLNADEPFDLALIDGDHSEEGCWRDFQQLRERTPVVAFHDIVSDVVPGVSAVWRRVREECAATHEVFEFTAQYASLQRRTGKRFLGIGVAARREHPCLSVESF